MFWFLPSIVLACCFSAPPTFIKPENFYLNITGRHPKAFESNPPFYKVRLDFPSTYQIVKTLDGSGCRTEANSLICQQTATADTFKVKVELVTPGNANQNPQVEAYFFDEKCERNDNWCKPVKGNGSDLIDLGPLGAYPLPVVIVCGVLFVVVFGGMFYLLWRNQWRNGCCARRRKRSEREGVDMDAFPSSNHGKSGYNGNGGNGGKGKVELGSGLKQISLIPHRSMEGLQAEPLKATTKRTLSTRSIKHQSPLSPSLPSPREKTLQLQKSIRQTSARQKKTEQKRELSDDDKPLALIKDDDDETPLGILSGQETDVIDMYKK